MMQLPRIISTPSIPRKLIHLAGISFLYPILMLHPWVTILAFLVVILGLHTLYRFVAYGLIGVCLLLAFADSQVAGAAWLTLIAGDGAAGICGLLWGKKILPWNNDKTMVGTLSFVVATCLVVTPFNIVVSHGSLCHSAYIGLLVALVAALVESLPLRLNDNFAVVLASGGIYWLSQMLWP